MAHGVFLVECGDNNDDSQKVNISGENGIVFTKEQNGAERSRPGTQHGYGCGVRAPNLAKMLYTCS
ncbi:hypothetical protein GCM10027578_11050 [Spirosoma luteolum]